MTRAALALLALACAAPTAPRERAPRCRYVPVQWTHAATGAVVTDSALVCQVAR